MAFRTLFVRDNTKLRLYLDNIVIETQKGPIKVLISDVQCIILDNMLLSISMQLLNKLVSENVFVVVCGSNHMPVATILSLKGNQRATGRLLDQIKWQDSIKAELTQAIIRAKISNQAKLLDLIHFHETSRKIMSYTDDVKFGDVTNREGVVAKMYFRALFGSKFVRFDEDVINAGLNYGYAILRSLISSILVSKGLSCSLGIFHKGRENSFNLSDDIIEVFRPLVDKLVYYHLLNVGEFGSDEKVIMAKVLNSRMIFDRQNQSLSQAIELYVERCLSILDETKPIQSFICPYPVFNDED